MDGYVVNKVGTLQIALAAQYNGIPYFVTGQPNLSHPTIDSVTIEERNPNLVMDSLGTVSYTHLDVYKRQICTNTDTNTSLIHNINRRCPASQFKVTGWAMCYRGVFFF